MDTAFATRIAHDWIEAWNAHDLDRILSLYADDFEISSPYIAKVLGVHSGSLKGKKAVRSYWEKALLLVPNLRFELLAVLHGVNSVALHYKGVNDRLCCEVLFFDANRLIVKVIAHYA